MNEHASSATSQNPFSTAHVRPGAVPYCFPPGSNVQMLLGRLEQNGWCGEIVGPHGSGKSALLATLIPALERAGKRTCLIELHDGQRRLPVDLRGAPELQGDAVVIVDGYEQLGALARFRLRRFRRRRRLGLVVTAHAPVGFPGLFRTATDIELARRIVAALLDEHPSVIPPEDVAAAFSHHDGDMRETLFELYDLYEQRRR